MKKILKLSLAAAILLPLASCNDDSKSNSYTVGIPVSAYNLVTAVDDASVVPTVGLSGYNVIFKSSDQENSLQIKSGSVVLPDGGSVSFTTKPILVDVSRLNVDDTAREVIKFSSENPSESGAEVTAISGLVTQSAFYPGSTEVKGYELEYPSDIRHYTIFDYVLNNQWRVRTFWRDMTFMGSTITTGQDMPGPYTNNKFRYRIYMKTNTNGALTGKADVIFYNAKFAERSPEMTIVVRDLDLKFSNSGYTVSGTDIIPDMVSDGGEFTPFPSFTFNNFTFTAVGDLTQATASYKVAGKYNGQFQGSSIVK
jgi:hypothetical protein